MKLFRVRAHDDAAVFFAHERPDGRLVGTGALLPGAVDGTGRLCDRADVDVLAPVVPGKIVCVGRNYAAHAKELGNSVPDEPVLFLKPPSALLDPGAPILRPVHMSSLVHHEGELAVVVGADCRHVAPADALANVFGYTCANDVTARDIQKREGVFGRAKGFDTFCPLGPAIVTADDIPDPQSLSLRLTVNGAVRQDASTAQMVFTIAHIIAFISRVMTLHRGDVVLTGTPEGVGPLLAGDLVAVDISSIGRLENPVVDSSLAP